MQHIHGILELDGVDNSVRSPSIVFNGVKNTRTTEALQNLRGTMLIAQLHEIQSVPEELSNIGGNSMSIRHLLLRTCEP